MKILFITHYDNMYGANRALLKLATKLSTNPGYQIMAVVPAEGDFADALRAANVSCIISPVTQWQATYVSFARQMVKKHIRKKAIRQEINNLYEILKDQNVDLIHSNSSVIGHGAILAKKLNAKHIWHIREFSEEHFGMKYFYKDSLVKSYYESATALICISDAIKANYIKRYPGANAIRVYDGVDDTVSRTEISKDNHQVFRFVYVGYLYHKKHQLEVIRACEKLNEITDIPYEMCFVGDGKEDYKSQLIAEIDKYNLTNVKLMGYVPDAGSFIAECDAGIIASEYEGFGLVTVEYMLNSLPVIGFNHSGTAEIVVGNGDNQTGFLYGTEEELVSYMAKLLTDSTLCEKLGTNGRKRALSDFNETLNADNIEHIYRQYLG